MRVGAPRRAQQGIAPEEDLLTAVGAPCIVCFRDAGFVLLPFHAGACRLGAVRILFPLLLDRLRVSFELLKCECARMSCRSGDIEMELV
jgi:hypothetical protein